MQNWITIFKHVLRRFFICEKRLLLPCWSHISTFNISKLQCVQNFTARLALKDWHSSSQILISKLHWLPVLSWMGIHHRKFWFRNYIGFLSFLEWNSKFLHSQMTINRDTWWELCSVLINLFVHLDHQACHGWHWHSYLLANGRLVCVPIAQGSGMHCPRHFEAHHPFPHSIGLSKLIILKLRLHLDPFRLPGPHIQ